MSPMRLSIGIGVALLCGLAGDAPGQLLQTQTYQGRLESGGTSALGQHQFRFRIFDAPAGGNLIAEANREKTFLTADNGLFTFSDLTFGDVFASGEDRWLEVGVREGAGGGYTVLGPRQPVTAAPTAGVARRLVLPYEDSGEIGASGAVFDLNNSSQAGWTMVLRSGPPTGLEWSDSVAVIDVAEGSGPTFGLIATANGAGIAGAALHDGSTGIQLERYASNPSGSAMRIFDYLTGNSIHFGTTEYAGDFEGAVRFTGDVDISGEEIEMGEILDEPGIVSSPGTGVGVTLTPVFGSIASRTITTPGPGMVLAIASADMQLNHASGTALNAVFGVSTVSTSLPSEQDIQVQLPAGAPTGIYNFPAAAHGVFIVPNAGTHTFHFVGREASGDGAALFDVTFTLIYLRTAYGLVQGQTPPPAGLQEPPQLAQPLRPPLSQEEVEQERRAALAWQMDRLDAKRREIEAILVEIEALRSRASVSAIE